MLDCQSYNYFFYIVIWNQSSLMDFTYNFVMVSLFKLLIFESKDKGHNTTQQKKSTIVIFKTKFIIYPWYLAIIYID